MPSTVWKYTWNSSGYPSQEVFLDFSNIPLGTIIKLPHTYYKSQGFSIGYSTGTAYTTLTVGEDIPGSTSDVVWVNKEEDLSKLAGSSVYSKLKINKPRALKKQIKINVNYVGDAFDPDDFGQQLNQTSDVIHKSLTVTGKLQSPTISSEELSSNTLLGNFGKISSSEVSLTSGNFSFGASGKLSEFGNVIPGKEWILGNVVFRQDEFNRMTMKDPNYGDFKPIVVLNSTSDFAYVPIVIPDRPTTLFNAGIQIDVTNQKGIFNAFQMDELTLGLENGIVVTKEFMQLILNRITSLEQRVYLLESKQI